MKRPLLLAKNLQQKFQSYIETDFWALNTDFQNARKVLLNDPVKKAIFQEPWFEIVKTYKSSGKKVEDLNITDFNDQLTQYEVDFFKQLVKGGLIDEKENITLYAHQLKMITRYWDGYNQDRPKNLVITTGTGSGKTESFLLPLFSYLSKYYYGKGAATINNNPNKNDLWYKNYRKTIVTKKGKSQEQKTYTPVQHRQNDADNACVKAVIFYPMNALVADQMNRLRSALASPDTLNLFQQTGKGRLYFGKYNSTLKVARYNRNGGLSNKSEIAQEMVSYYKAYKKLKEKSDANPNDKKVKELFASTPNPLGSELLNRWDMQQTPPDILITNYSMLNVMMMRQEEDAFFTNTRNWLAADTQNNIFHLIIDELHLNRGTAGAEVAWLLRLYLHRLGLEPGHPQLRILASSASLEGDKAKEFLEDFFGYNRGTCDNHFTIVKDEYADIPNINTPILSDDQLLQVFNYLPEKNYERGNPKQMIQDIFHQNDLNQFLDSIKAEIAFKINQCYSADVNRKTISKTELANALFANQNGDNQEKCLEALFYLRSLFDERKDGRELPRLRMHLLYNNLPGLYTKMDSLSALTNDPFKMIEGNTRLAQLLVCYECGTLAFGGYRHTISTPNGDEYEMLPVPKDLDASPDSYTQTIPDFMRYSEFILFWPDELNGKKLNADSEKRFDTAKFGGNVGNGGQWVSASLNPRNGRIKEGAVQGWIIGYLFKQIVPDDAMKALPSQCPCCAQKYHYNSQRTSPFRHFSTPHNKTAQVLTTQLLKEISSNVDERKLIVFSDSRNAAAKLSAQLEQDNYWDNMRKIVAFIARYSEQDQEMIHRIQGIQGLSWGELEIEIKEYIKAKGLVDGDLIQSAERRPDRTAYVKDIVEEFLEKINTLTNENQIRVSIADNILANANSTNLILKRLLQKGIPPMGNTFEVKVNNGGQNIHIPIREFDNLKWYNLYDLESGSKKTDYGDGNLNQREHINEELKKEFTRGLFGKNRFSIEMMAKGYVAFKKQHIDDLATQLNIVGQDDKQKLEEVANSFIRILGYKFRSIAHSNIIDQNDNKQQIGDFTATHPLRQYLNKVYTNRNDIHNAILNTLNGLQTTINNIAIGGIVDPAKFDLVLAKEDSDVYICDNCQTSHLHKSGGICTHCFADISNVAPVQAGSLWAKNYYTQNPEEDIIRLHCEELTGQTDDFEKRQRLFKNLFLDGEEELSEQIDVISATTTMEVGIDIGSLSATLMGNMAPERFNYQQRVGRAGRGGQAFSVALTVCRSNSHDAFYYFNPDKMLNEKPPVPLIPIDLVDIKERFYYKELLRQVSMNVENPEIEDQLNAKDTHGRLGKTADYKDANSNFRQNLITSLSQTLTQNDFLSWSDSLNIFKTIDEIRIKLDEATDRSPLPMGLASALAENGVLPMYGMPTNVRVAYLRGGGEVDRDAELALTEFAPNAELLKDKKYYPMEGITSPRYKIGNEQRNDGVDDEHNTFYYLEQNNNTFEVFDQVPEGQGEFRKAIIPKAYYSNKEVYETDNNKQRHQVSLPKIDGSIAANMGEINGLNSVLASCFNGRYFVFNDNGGRDFQFFENNHNTNKRNFNQWSLDANDIPKGSFTLANKTFTTLLELNPAAVHPGLRFGLYQDGDTLSTFRNTVIQAAAYSAAFILRNVYTTDKDIDGEEIRILKLRQQNAELKLNILFADKLVNGSGFCRELYDNLAHYFNLCFNPNNPFSSRILSDENLTCDTASYQNLMNFRNQKFHPILDWRLGLSYLRMLKHQDIDSILSASSDLHEFKNYNGANSWLNGFKSLFQEWVETTQLGNYHVVNNIPVCERDGNYIVGIHPLWDVENPIGILQQTVQNLNGGNIVFVDSFNIMRRPGACYKAAVDALPNNAPIPIP